MRAIACPLLLLLLLTLFTLTPTHAQQLSLYPQTSFGFGIPNDKHGPCFISSSWNSTLSQPQSVIRCVPLAAAWDQSTIQTFILAPLGHTFRSVSGSTQFGCALTDHGYLRCWVVSEIVTSVDALNNDPSNTFISVGTYEKPWTTSNTQVTLLRVCAIRQDHTAQCFEFDSPSATLNTIPIPSPPLASGLQLRFDLIEPSLQLTCGVTRPVLNIATQRILCWNDTMAPTYRDQPTKNKLTGDPAGQNWTVVQLVVHYGQGIVVALYENGVVWVSDPAISSTTQSATDSIDSFLSSDYKYRQIGYFVDTHLPLSYWAGISLPDGKIIRNEADHLVTIPPPTNTIFLSMALSSRSICVLTKATGVLPVDNIQGLPISNLQPSSTGDIMCLTTSNINAGQVPTYVPYLPRYVRQIDDTGNCLLMHDGSLLTYGTEEKGVRIRRQFATWNNQTFIMATPWLSGCLLATSTGSVYYTPNVTSTNMSSSVPLVSPPASTAKVVSLASQYNTDACVVWDSGQAKCFNLTSSGFIISYNPTPGVGLNRIRINSLSHACAIRQIDQRAFCALSPSGLATSIATPSSQYNLIYNTSYASSFVDARLPPIPSDPVVDVMITINTNYIPHLLMVFTNQTGYYATFVAGMLNQSTWKTNPKPNFPNLATPNQAPLIQVVDSNTNGICWINTDEQLFCWTFTGSINLQAQWPFSPQAQIQFQFQSLYYNSIIDAVCGITRTTDKGTPPGQVFCDSFTFGNLEPLAVDSVLPLQASGLAPQNSYIAGSELKACTLGKFSANDGAINAICNGLCASGRFGNTTSTDDQCTALCPQGSYCLTGTGLPVACAAGSFGATFGLSSSKCSGKASPGYWSPAGAVQVTPCPPGSYGATSGLTTSTCTGLCDEGYLCSAASSSSKQAVCGNPAFYCQAGSIQPTIIGPGFYGSKSAVQDDPSTYAASAPCQAGFSCTGDGTQTPCPKGTSSGVQSSYCAACSPGRFQNETGQASCKLCETGTATNDNGQTKCQPCGPSTFSPVLIGASYCQACSAGSANHEVGLYSPPDIGCPLCTGGTFSNSTHCNQCPSGTWSSVGSSQCQQCIGGVIRSDQSACDQDASCPANTYLDENGSRKCELCALGTTSQPGATVCSVCPANTYTPGLGSGCISCAEIEGLACANGLASVLPGYWCYETDATNQNDLDQFQLNKLNISYRIFQTTSCPNDLCLGADLQIKNETDGHVISITTSTQCPADEHRLQSENNLLCAECDRDAGYIGWYGECVQCDTVKGGAVFLMIVITWIFTVILYWCGSASSFASGLILIILYFLQTSHLEVGESSSLLSWLRVFNLNAANVGGAKTCLGPMTPYQQTILAILTPLIMMVELSVICFVHGVMWKLTGGKSQANESDGLFTRWLRSFSFSHYIAGFFSILLFTYTQVSSTCLSFLHCVDVGSLGRVVYSEPTLVCDSGSYNDVKGLVIAALVIYICLLPVAMAFFLAKGRTWIVDEAEDNSESIKTEPSTPQSSYLLRYSPFLLAFRSPFFYWTLLILVKRLAFVIVNTFLILEPSIRACLFVLLNFTSYCGQVILSPYRNPILNKLDQFVHIGLVVISALLTIYPRPPFSHSVEALLFIVIVPTACVLILHSIWKEVRRREKRRVKGISGPIASSSRNGGNGATTGSPNHSPHISPQKPPQPEPQHKQSTASMILSESTTTAPHHHNPRVTLPSTVGGATTSHDHIELQVLPNKIQLDDEMIDGVPYTHNPAFGGGQQQHQTQNQDDELKETAPQEEDVQNGNGNGNGNGHTTHENIASPSHMHHRTESTQL